MEDDRAIEKIATELAKMFGCPCNYDDETITAICKDNCGQNGRIDDKECWKKFLRKWECDSKQPNNCYGTNVNRCVSCGMVIPEGLQVCFTCSNGGYDG